MVRHSSAKGIYGGSIPPQASLKYLNMLRYFRIDICPSGGTGIRARLKIVSRKGCGFDSHLGHNAGVAELVYALVLGTSVARLEGSSPSSSTKI